MSLYSSRRALKWPATATLVRTRKNFALREYAAADLLQETLSQEGGADTLAALIIGASLAPRMETPFTIHGYSRIAMIFLLTAAIAGLVLVDKMTFSAHTDCS